MSAVKSGTSTIRQLLPEPIKRIMRPWYRRALDIRYEHHLSHLHTNKKQLLILATVARSGTHYAKFLLANYLKLASGYADGPVSPAEMNSMLPNIWHRAYLGSFPNNIRSAGPRDYEKPTAHLALLGLNDIPRSHYEYQRYYWDESPVLHLYRNPLDYAVSIYYYKYKNRTGRTSTQDATAGNGRSLPIVSSPVEALDLRFDDYVRMYLSYRTAARAARAQLLRISYEDLKRYPQACLRIILRWLGVEPEPSHIEMAACYSSIDTVQQLEGTKGPINPGAKDLTGKFARDGSIGQWRKYFSNAEVDGFRERFRRVGISLDEFTLET